MIRWLMEKDDWLEKMWDHAWESGRPCASCEHYKQECGWSPFDVEPRLQEWMCEADCAANDAIDCPYVSDMVEELAGEVEE